MEKSIEKLWGDYAKNLASAGIKLFFYDDEAGNSDIMIPFQTVHEHLMLKI